ncbi:MAG TPA: pyrroloquinoline quinone biosynthesis protein PqqE [Bryobacteraceae bacterium]|nr:pyrroloquinoline quinone biosynthesis protein PqqE [Bryobacteraceae bacterium]
MTFVPRALIAEVTHRCPLRCVYCSNPLEMRSRSEELTTAEWQRVFGEAAALGVLQLHLTGGEPLARPDAEQLVKSGRAAGLYVNLITSGIGLAEARLEALVAAGLDHVQLSFQDSGQAGADEIAGTRAHAAKLELAQRIRKHRIAFTMNIVVHRQNLARLPEMIALAEELGVDKLEVANVQYYGWAFENRGRLLPSREQVRETVAIVDAARERLKGRMRIDCVLPDYYARYPKPCMGGWGQGLMLIDPAGVVLPCHAARVIPGLNFDDVRSKPLQWIWNESAAFQRFRGDDWMQEPCRSCERKTRDFGGCRCQAFLYTGDADATDPVCSLAPQRGLIDAVIVNAATSKVEASAPKWVYRINPSNAPAHTSGD